MTRAALSGVLILVGAAAAVSPAAAKGGPVGGSGNDYYLSSSGVPDLALTYGRHDDEVFVGDWDGDGTDTLAIRRGATFHVRNALDGGPADVAFTYGRAGDVVLVGDWDGDGTDTLAVRRGNEYHVSNSLDGGPADRVARYGRAGDLVLVGDWDGDGTDTLAVRRGKAYHLRNSLTAGDADHVVLYGRDDDDVYVGDHDGDGDDSFTVRRERTYHVTHALTGGTADQVLVYGRAGDATLVGDWDGDGRDTLGVRRDDRAGITARSTISRVTAAQLSASWRPGCPVPVDRLRAVDVPYVGYDGAARTGRLIVAADVAEDVAAIMEELYDAGFPIQRMVPVDAYGGDDGASMAANNTSAFNCRTITGGSGWSEHSYGRAIDINPLANPYVAGSTVLPAAGWAYADRIRDAAGMIHAGDEVVRAFAERGWLWGGYWTYPKDYQHFSTSGR